MQKGNSTGKLPAGENVNKFKHFYENLSSSDLITVSDHSKPKCMNGKPGKPDEPDLKPDRLDSKTAKPHQTGSNISKTPPKPALPRKPAVPRKPGNLGKNGEKSQDSSPPSVPPKPKSRGASTLSEESNTEQEIGQNRCEAEQNGFHNGHEDKTDDVAEDPEPVADVNEEGVIVAEKAEDVDAEKIEGDEEDEEDEDGWDTDEFESDSDDRDEALPDKRQSRIIFDELDDIPDLGFLDPRKKKLFNIAKEILTTEITYVKTLKLLDEVFYFRLDNECRAKGIIPAEALLEIFSNITTINKFHRDFLLPKLEERMKNWDTTPRVGDIFNYLAPFLKMYADYVKNFDQGMTSLAKWKLKSPKFSAVIEDIQKTEKECNNLTVEHHMLAPVQRVPRYKLLLTDYVSKLPEDSPDMKESKKSLEIISSAANHANESMKKTERFQKMLEMQDKFGDGVSIVTPSREFIMEGELIKISARNAQIMTRILVLFNDSVFYCTKVAATGKYKVKQTVELLSTHLEEPDEETENRELVFRVCSKSKVTDFQATSVEQKEKWVSTLTEAIKKAVEKNSTFGREVTIAETNDIGKIAPVWVRDDAVTMCMTCTTHFTTLRRRHHCRACGKIVCNNCSSYKARLEYDKNRINRVCMNCFKVLTKEDAKPSRKPKIHKFADSVLCGYLQFRTDSTKAWSKRWCMLGDDFTLHVFKAKKDVKAQTTIPLPGYKIVNENSTEENDKNGKRVFKVSHKAIRGSFEFEADNDETMDKWLEHIDCAIRAESYPSRASVASSVSDVPTPPPSPG